MYFTQAILAKTGTAIFSRYETEAKAKHAATILAKDDDYAAVWYGSPERMEARIQVK